MKRLFHSTALLALFALLFAALAACGGDDDDDDGADDGGNGGDATQPTGDGGDDDGDGDGFDFGAGVARVTVGDMTYEFDLSAEFVVCRDVFDAIQVAGNSAENEEISINGWIPPTNWETFDDGRYDPPSITVEDDANNFKWVADAGRGEILTNFPAEAVVTNYEKDGLSAQGTATFVDEYALFSGDAAILEGTFEISCEE